MLCFNFIGCGSFCLFIILVRDSLQNTFLVYLKAPSASYFQNPNHGISLPRKEETHIGIFNHLISVILCFLNWSLLTKMRSGKCMHGAMTNRQSCYWNLWYLEKASLFGPCPVHQWLWNVSIIIKVNPRIVIWKCIQDAYKVPWVGDAYQAETQCYFLFCLFTLYDIGSFTFPRLNSITNKLIENNKCIFTHALLLA